MTTTVYDLDNTLCRTRGTDYMNATPIWSRIRRVNAEFESGVRVVIDTARGSSSGEDWTERTREQLDKWGVKYDVLRCGVKFPADRYVDDKAMDVVDWEAAA